MSPLALDLLVVAAANALVATLLGLVAWVLLRCRQHGVAHFVCVLALVKLVTPPLVRLPVVAAPEPTAALSAEALLEAALALADEPEAAPADARPQWPVLAAAAALLGSCLLALRAALRTRRFRRLLRLAADPPAWLAERARTLAERMRLPRCPQLLVVPARISPMLCVLGRRAHILLPRALLAAPRPELDALLAHELAHAGRRDHWVRALELLATVLYWWLPSAWLVRRTLRVAEERCCDERVMTAIPGGERAYANALLATLDLLAGAARAMPPVACGAGVFADMKTRLTMIMTAAPSRPMSWTLRAALLVGATLVLPIAPILAQDESAPPVSREELRAARDEIRKLRAELEAVRAQLTRTLPGREREPAGARDRDDYRELIDRLHRRDTDRERGGKEQLEVIELDKARIENLHQDLLHKAQLDREGVHELLQKLHRQDADRDVAGKDQLEALKRDKIKLERFHDELLHKAQLDSNGVRALMEKLHRQDADRDADGKKQLEALELDKMKLEKFHDVLLHKAQVDSDGARALLEKVYREHADRDPDGKKRFEAMKLDKMKLDKSADAADTFIKLYQHVLPHPWGTDELHKELEHKARLDHEGVRELMEKLHGHDGEAMKLDKIKLQKLHEELLHKARLDDEGVHDVIEKLDRHDADRYLEKAKVEKANQDNARLDKAKFDKARSEKVKAETLRKTKAAKELVEESEDADAPRPLPHGVR